MSRQLQRYWGGPANPVVEQSPQGVPEAPAAEPTEAGFLDTAEFKAAPAKKIPVHIRMSPEVLAWFKKAGPGYQSRINQVLETYVAHQQGRKEPGA